LYRYDCCIIEIDNEGLAMMQKKNISSWKSLLGSPPAIKGLLIGTLIGIFDFLLSYSMGVRIELEGNDIQFLVTFYFTISFACFT
jgi:hypothetical protein